MLRRRPSSHKLLFLKKPLRVQGQDSQSFLYQLRENLDILWTNINFWSWHPKWLSLNNCFIKASEIYKNQTNWEVWWILTQTFCWWMFLGRTESYKKLHAISMRRKICSKRNFDIRNYEESPENGYHFIIRLVFDLFRIIKSKQ